MILESLLGLRANFDYKSEYFTIIREFSEHLMNKMIYLNELKKFEEAKNIKSNCFFQLFKMCCGFKQSLQKWYLTDYHSFKNSDSKCAKYNRSDFLHKSGIILL